MALVVPQTLRLPKLGGPDKRRAWQPAQEWEATPLRLGGGEHRRDPHLLPAAREYHKHLKSINMLERMNEEIKRRTRVVRIFPNAESCLRLIRALAADTHEGWLEEHRYLNMQFLSEQKKEELRRLDETA